MGYKIATQASDEDFSVSAPGLPGCWSQGATEEEALQNIQDAIVDYLAVARRTQPEGIGLRAPEAVMTVSYRVEIEQEDGGRFLAEVVDLPGVMAYGDTAELALAHAQALALRGLADRLDHDEGPRGAVSVTFETSAAA